MRTAHRLLAIGFNFLLAAAAVFSGAATADGHPSLRADRSTEPLLFHIHGLAFSPDGKALLAPSHTGLAVYRDDGWSEVNGPIHDFAGFSLTERAIYASGHPPAGSSLPNPLGLVKSTDLGVNWTSLALGGEADFHLLAAGYRSDAIYVLNTEPNSAMPAPGLHRSVDEGRTWRRRIALGLAGNPFGIAAHPQDAGILAVATDRGLYLSRDSGESFKRMDGRQAVTAVSFDPDGRNLHFARAIRRELVSAALDSRSRTVMRLPPIGLDYVTHIAHSPADQRMLAIATDRRHVFVTSNAGKEWRQIAKDGELP
jgi:DNA-binding beta-propeller fold protein YncE